MIYLKRSKLQAIGETVAWLLGRRTRIRISGDSMLPTLVPGQFVLVDRDRLPKVDELALARHPNEEDLLVVKRIGSITDDGRYVLSSDNEAAGTDSRTWGPVAADALQGTVTHLLDRPNPPPER